MVLLGATVKIAPGLRAMRKLESPVTRLYSGILNSEGQNGRSGIDLKTTIIRV